MTFEEISAAFFFAVVVVGIIGFAYLCVCVLNEDKSND